MTLAFAGASPLQAALPGLRAFALSLVGDASRADDLVQETVLRAWARQELFIPGSNLKAWLCTILRNQFYTDLRKTRREVEDVDGTHAGQMTSPSDQEDASPVTGLVASNRWATAGAASARRSGRRPRPPTSSGRMP